MLNKALLAVVLPMIVALPTASVDTVLAMKKAGGPPARKAEGLPAAAADAGTGSDKGFPNCYYLKCTLANGISASGQSCVPDLSGDFCTSPHSVSDGYCYYFKCSKTNGFNAPGQTCVVDPDGGMCQRNPVNPDGTWKIAPSPPPLPPPSPPPAPPPRRGTRSLERCACRPRTVAVDLRDLRNDLRDLEADLVCDPSRFGRMHARHRRRRCRRGDPRG